MVIIGSSNARVGLERGMEILRAGGSALDAVEQSIWAVESNVDDHSVGLGGLPNFLGEVELDASIMDGDTLMAGAVGGVHGVLHPISLARRVMEELPHSLLVGAGAERFARECGFPETNLLTDEAREIYERGIHGRGEETSGRYASQVLRALVGRTAMDPERASGRDAGTVNVIALDLQGHLAVGVSTSGFAWKYPGRVGDSAVIGAGNYCDDRYGAAGCTGRGEMAIRASTAYSIVRYLKEGRTPEDAGHEAFMDLGWLVDAYWSGMNAVVLAPDGQHAAFSTVPNTTYVYMDDRSTGVESAPRHLVEVAGRRR